MALHLFETLAGCCGFGFLLTIFQLLTWKTRQGLYDLDCTMFLMFPFFFASMMGNCIFIGLLINGVYIMVENQDRSMENFLIPEASESSLFVLGLIFACFLKCFDMIGLVTSQCRFELFFVDWEPPPGNRAKVSAWRRILIAREWNRLQTFRKTRFTIQLLLILLLLEIFELKKFAQVNPRNLIGNINLSEYTCYSQQNPSVAYNKFLRFAVASSTYVAVEALQVVYQLVIHERFIRSKVNDFVDLCTVSNISVFILRNRYFGYYIHGRSPVGRSDTDMQGLNNMLRREQADVVPRRGLDQTVSQTFQIATLPKFRAKYKAPYKSVEALLRNPVIRRAMMFHQGKLESAQLARECAKACSNLRSFLTSFIDHSLGDLQYRIQYKTWLERILNTEFKQPSSGVCIFYPDGKSTSFTYCLHYGQELRLVIFDAAVFTFCDFMVCDFLLSAVVTYVVVKFFAMMYQWLGRGYLESKAFVFLRFV